MNESLFTCFGIYLFGITFAHAHNYFREESRSSVSNNKMSSRDNLKKLNKTALQKICIDMGFDVKKKRKEELIDFLFTSGVQSQHITPVIDQDCHHTGAWPRLDDQVHVDNTILPPFNKCNYTIVPYKELPSPSFVSIYNFMITRARASCADRGVQNFKGMDRAVRHFEAGDVQDIRIAQVYKTYS